MSFAQALSDLVDQRVEVCINPGGRVGLQIIGTLRRHENPARTIEWFEVEGTDAEVTFFMEDLTGVYTANRPIPTIYILMGMHPL